jgi:predicted phosphodiesterase
LQGPDPDCPVIICITGDLAQTAHITEFKSAEEFVRGLARMEIFGRPRGMEAIFIVPGNHDVKYDSSDIGERWQQWTEFSNRLFGTDVKREDPWSFTCVHDRSDDLGAIIVTLNSSTYVQKGKPDEERGRLDVKQLTLLEEQLEEIDSNQRNGSIRIALMHHHPILLPSLAEPGRGYDAVHNSGKLLAILKRYGFHLILHGHKHSPHTFTDDTRPAHQVTSDHPIFVAAGGSVGSTELPNAPRLSNCYNQIVVKWHFAGSQSRVRVVTRGLRIYNEADGTERLPTRWDWYSMRVDDRKFYEFGDVPPLERAGKVASFQEAESCVDERKRCEEYERTRGNLPVVVIQPSLVPGQAYEAVVWIEGHPRGQRRKNEQIPESVIWSAGPKHEVVTVGRGQSDEFAACFTYWGPMLVQGKLIFADGNSALVHVYARLPRPYG